MKVSQIDKNINFNGKVIVKNAISSNQKYLLNLHKNNLDNMIKDLPFDLFVEQSKSKKTISLYTNVENTVSYIVKKNKQNFEEAAGFAIEDGKKKSKIYQDIIKADKMLNLCKGSFVDVIFGNFKLAREQEKELAIAAIKDFDVYKKIPPIRFTNAPLSLIMLAFLNGMKYRIYRAFSSKIPEEKQFFKMKQDYLKELKAKNIKPKTVTLELLRFY